GEEGSLSWILSWIQPGGRKRLATLENISMKRTFDWGKPFEGTSLLPYVCFESSASHVRHVRFDFFDVPVCAWKVESVGLEMSSSWHGQVHTCEVAQHNLAYAGCDSLKQVSQFESRSQTIRHIHQKLQTISLSRSLLLGPTCGLVVEGVFEGNRDLIGDVAEKFDFVPAEVLLVSPR